MVSLLIRPTINNTGLIILTRSESNEFITVQMSLMYIVKLLFSYLEQISLPDGCQLIAYITECYRGNVQVYLSVEAKSSDTI